MALRRKIVDLVGPYLAHDMHDRHGVAKVGVMQMEMRMAFKMCDPLTEIHRRSANRAVDVISFLQQELRQVAPVLSGHPGD